MSEMVERVPEDFPLVAIGADVYRCIGHFKMSVKMITSDDEGRPLTDPVRAVVVDTRNYFIRYDEVRDVIRWLESFVKGDQPPDYESHILRPRENND